MPPSLKQTVARFSLSTFVLALWLQPAAAFIPTSRTLPVLDGFAAGDTSRFIIMFEDSVGANDMSLLESYGVDVKHAHSIIPAISGKIDQSKLAILAKHHRIARIVPDMRVHAMLSESVPLIEGDKANTELLNTGNGVRVCVVDTGVDVDHPSLNPLVAQYDFVNNDGNADDDNGHGTHVAGIIASTHETNRGVAPDTSIMAAKVLNGNGSGSASDVIAGIDWCVQNGADVINMSLGGGTYAGACDDEPISIASNAAVDAGVTVLIASGNNGRDDRISAPACSTKSMAIGSVNKDDTRGSYSNGGQLLDVVAPGTSILANWPNGGFRQLTGTSMATPHAAGLAALLLSQDPSLTPDQVRDVMRNTATDLGAPGFDFLYGHGRIEAYDAVLSIFNGPPPPPPPPPPEPETNTVFSDDFSSLGNWSQTGGNHWQSEPAAEDTQPGKSASDPVAHIDGCDANNGCKLTLNAPVDLSSYESAELSFWRYVDRSIDNGEYLKVQINDGSGWSTVFNWTHNDGDTDVWSKETVNLGSQYMNPNFQVRFVGKMSSSREDAEVDDVEITGTLPLNSGPQANAGLDINTTDDDGSGDESVTLNGSASSDDTGITSYLWKNGEDVLGTEVEITVDLPVGVHTITLTVEDDEGMSNSDDVVVTVLANTPPVASAGDDQTVNDTDGSSDETVTLDGSSSSDADGAIASYEWKEGEDFLGTEPSISPTLTVGTHTITLTVTDNGGASHSDDVVVTVTENQAPTANAGENQTVMDSDDSGSEVVTLDGSASSDDGSIASFEWTQLVGTSATVVGSTAQITPDLPIGTHEFTLTVTDNTGLTNSDDVSVTVEPYEAQAPVANAGEDQTLSDSDGSESEPVTLDGSGSSDDKVIVSYEWHKEGTGLGSGSSISTDLPVGTHTITLTVEDDEGLTSTDDVVITVTENQAPTAAAGDDQTVTDEDLDTEETVILDASSSSDADGTIISYEWKEGEDVLGTDASISPTLSVGTHTITLTVTDNGGASHSDDVEVIVEAGTPEPPAPSTPFSDDFQSGLGQWTLTNEKKWEIDTVSEEVVPGHGGGNLVAHAGNCDDSCTLTTKNTVDLSPYNSATLSFWRFVDSSIDNNEYLRVQAYNGSSWVTLAEWTNGSGDTDDWQFVSFDLAGFLVSDFKLRFISKQSSSLEEVELDDVEIVGN